jgi:micrococcal nuclease
MGKRKLRFSFKKLVIPLLVLSLALNGWFLVNRGASSGIPVMAVLDGDTILLDGKVRVRLRHVDAPELTNCGGKEAKEQLQSLVEGKNVVVREQILDQRGRPLALVYVGKTLVNEELLESGWGRWHHDQSSKAESLKAIADTAKEGRIGIYSQECYQTEPLDPECNIKANIDKNSTRRNYYYPGCPQYKFTIVEKDLGEQWFCSEKEAQAAGFTKAKNCP